MERENYLGTVQSRSRFEESAAGKISDTRNHDSVISDRNAVTANGLDNARTIHEKLNEHKYAAADVQTTVSAGQAVYAGNADGNGQTGDKLERYVARETAKKSTGEPNGYAADEPSGYRTETELHYDSGASSDLYKTPDAAAGKKTNNRGQSYMAMLQGKEKGRKQGRNRNAGSGRQYGNGREKKVAAERYNLDRNESAHSCNQYVGNSGFKSSDILIGPYVAYGKNGRTANIAIEQSTGRYSGNIGSGNGRYLSEGRMSTESLFKGTASGRYSKASNSQLSENNKSFAKGQSSGKYISVADPAQPLSRTERYVNAQRYNSYSNIYLSKLSTDKTKGRGLQNRITLDSQNRATQRLKRYRISIGRAGDSEEGATSYITKKGVAIPSKIVQKAKGTEESKAKTLSKLTGNQKTSFARKTVSTGGASGKFKKKISGGMECRAGKIRDAAIGSAAYKISQDDESNAAVEAMLASGRASYQVTGRAARKINAKANNANARKYFEKLRRKGTFDTQEHSCGKYAFKAKRSPTEAANRAAQNKAKAQAQRKTQQLKFIQKFRQSKAKEAEAVTVFQEIKQTAIKVAKKLAEFARRNVAVIISVAGFLVLFIVVAAGLSSCAMAFADGAGTYMSGTTGTGDYDMTDSDSYLKEKEMELQEEIDNIEEEYPDYDEYVLDIADIGHDATKLMAYLTAKYDSYTLDDVKAELDELFDLIYILTTEEKTETRTRMVEKEAEDGTTYEVEEEYEWKILYVTLEKKDFDEIATPRLPDSDSQEMYDIYKDTGGAHQAFYNPFTVDWSEHVSSEFGWRIHPITGKEKFHNGIDIAMAEGTEVHSSSSGTVIQSYYSESAGNYVVVQDESGYTAHYMHLSSRSVAVGDVIKHGEIIGKVGSTGNSTGPHLHFGVKDASGEWINPRFVLSDYVKE